MSKNFKTGKKGSFSQKRRNLTEIEELEESGILDTLSNRQRLYTKKGYDHSEDAYNE
tara:strand:- start:355 stop:525 length:171 start_codon:yes stop_codon:yes gene_type:complete